jgi:hypothetical protein
MTTKADLRRGLRQMLSDASAWPDSQLDAWCEQAIYDYSLHFPYPRSASWQAAAGVRSYNIYAMAATLLIHAVLGVEYPAGQEPPRMLARRSEREDGFYGGAYYDLRLEGYAQVLVLGETPQGGESIRLTYEAEHVYPALDSSNLSVPDKHIELLRLFVQWKAVSALELSEAVEIARKETLLAALGSNSRGLELAYRRRVQELLLATAPGGWVAGWEQGRVY